jgi:hypothetical protein
VPWNGKKAEEWSSKDKFGVVLETAGLNEAEVAEYLPAQGFVHGADSGMAVILPGCE